MKNASEPLARFFAHAVSMHSSKTTSTLNKLRALTRTIGAHNGSLQTGSPQTDSPQQSDQLPLDADVINSTDGGTNGGTNGANGMVGMGPAASALGSNHQKAPAMDPSVGDDGAQRSHRGEPVKAPPKQRLRKHRCALRGGANGETGGSGVSVGDGAADATPGLVARAASMEALRDEMRTHMRQQQATAQATSNELLRRMDEITRLLQKGCGDLHLRAASPEEQVQPLQSTKQADPLEA